MTAPRIAPVAEPLTDTRPDTAWRVVVLNDPVNLTGYVVLVFRKVLGMNREDAEKHMMEVHRLGRSVVWSGDREPAELHVHELQSWHLRAILEKDDDADV